MHAVIRLKKGGYYCSAVFGCYDDGKENNGTETYYIVFDREKKRLIKQPRFRPELLPSLERKVLLFDKDRSDWNIDARGYGGVDFLPKKEALRLVEEGKLSGKLMKRCTQLDSSVRFKESGRIRTEEDIKQFLLISGYFHDACITRLEKRSDGAVSVQFKGMWGCSVELCFSGNVSYCTESRDPEKWDPYWFGASVLLHQGYCIFVDDEDISAEDINDSYCWFKAKSMEYRIIFE